ncbi:MAG TPA: hypothetical protein VFG89_09705 [Coriobacteriia bacterium]|nr:hypothetical protein [Coriobacteriia bacterium]
MRRLVTILLAAACAALVLTPALASAVEPTVNSYIVQNGNTGTNSTTVSVQMNVSDATEMQFSVDTSATWTDWVAYAETTSVVLPAVDGTYVVQAHFKSATGETVDKIPATGITLDTVTPHAQLHTDPAAGPAVGWYKSVPVFWFTAEEPVGVFYYWDSPPWSPFYPGSETTSPTAQPAPAVLYYYAQDYAANAETVINTTFNVDGTPPTASAAGLPSVGWTNAAVTVDVSGADVGGSGLYGVRSIVDGVESPVSSRTVFAEGTHNLEYWSIDGAGNDSEHHTALFGIEKTAPVTASNAVASYVRTAAIVLAPTDGGGSGIASTEWRVDGGAWQFGTLVNIATLGTHTVEYRSTDVAGNVETPKSASIRVWSATSLVPASQSSAPAYGSSPKVGVQLVDSAGVPLANKTVTVSRIGGTWSTKVPTNADGYVYVESLVIDSARSYQLSFAGDDSYEGSAVTYTFLPKVKLARATSWKTIYKNRAYYASGYIAPKHAKSNSNKVKIHVYKKGADKKYHAYKTFTAAYSTPSSSTWPTRYSAKVVIKSKGRYKLIAHHLADSANADTWGSWDYFTVK